VSQPKKPSESKEWNLIGDYANALERIGELQRENERLRKAGDSVVLCLCAETTEKHKQDCAKAWLTARGVQS